MSGVTLSKEHGLNPGLENCFYCNEPRGLILFGAIGRGSRMHKAIQASGKDIGRNGEAPNGLILNKEPCQKCAEYMKMGVILISVREPHQQKYRTHSCLKCKNAWAADVELSEHTPNISGEATPWCPACGSKEVASSSVQEPDDPQNPYRTGGWVVVRDELIERIISPKELCDEVLRRRMAFVPDDAWNMLGLPRGER